MRNQNQLQRLLVPLVTMVTDVKALLPGAAVRVVKGQKVVDVQQLKTNVSNQLFIKQSVTVLQLLLACHAKLTCTSSDPPFFSLANWQPGSGLAGLWAESELLLAPPPRFCDALWCSIESRSIATRRLLSLRSCSNLSIFSWRRDKS